MPKKTSIAGRAGFSLLEIIVSFLLLAMLAVLFVSLFNGAFRDSPTFMTNLQRDVDLATVMENMVQDYLQNYKGNLAGLKTKIEGGGGGYGNYSVKECKYVAFDSATGAETNDAGGSQTILKVTIQSAESGNTQTLTYLFTATE